MQQKRGINKWKDDKIMNSCRTAKKKIPVFQRYSRPRCE